MSIRQFILNYFQINAKTLQIIAKKCQIIAKNFQIKFQTFEFPFTFLYFAQYQTSFARQNCTYLFINTSCIGNPNGMGGVYSEKGYIYAIFSAACYGLFSYAVV
jgi:hypothetical protein